MKKNIVIIYSFIELYNGNSAGSARVMNYARALSSECKVIILSFQRSRSISLENIEEVETNIFTIGKKKSRSNKLSKLLFYPLYLYHFVLSISNLIKNINNNHSVALLLYPATNMLVDVFSVLFFIKYKGYKVFYELNELRRYAVSLDGFGKYHPKRLKFILSEYLIKFFEGVICISSSIEEYISKKNKNTLRIPILTDKKLLKHAKSKDTLEGEVFKIGFFGSVNEKKENLFLFLESLSLIKKQNDLFHFDLYGSIDSFTKKELPSKIEYYNLQGYVEYKGKLNQDSLPKVMRQYDLLVIPRGSTLQNEYGFSTKLSEYMASGVPVLVTDVSDNAIYITNGVNGFIAEPDSVESMVSSLSEVFLRKNDLGNIAEAAKFTVKKSFIYENYTEQLSHFLCKKL